MAKVEDERKTLEITLAMEESAKNYTTIRL